MVELTVLLQGFGKTNSFTPRISEKPAVFHHRVLAKPIVSPQGSNETSRFTPQGSGETGCLLQVFGKTDRFTTGV